MQNNIDTKEELEEMIYHAKNILFKMVSALNFIEKKRDEEKKAKWKEVEKLDWKTRARTSK